MVKIKICIITWIKMLEKFLDLLLKGKCRPGVAIFDKKIFLHFTCRERPNLWYVVLDLWFFLLKFSIFELFNHTNCKLVMLKFHFLSWMENNSHFIIEIFIFFLPKCHKFLSISSSEKFFVKRIHFDRILWI